MAKFYGALVIVLEHRYYGKSLPFGEDSLNLTNIKYLNADQAMADLAYFIQAFSANNNMKVNATTPWVTIGCSYPGALAAWFREKYPHLTAGSLSSSGVVFAIEQFT
mmetsp:Transcript_79444/g.110376  ORF Transcript_79444/g.110376 Transcript_79444/m.110376 type:complete len:107 (+) Transcript_79444:296-616(+)